ncbi:MAG: type II secretion system protein GspM [Gammaproteobacteria bacterium]
MKVWWHSLQERERTILLFGGSTVVAAVIFLGVMEPLAQKRETLTTKLTAEKLMLGRISDYAEQARAIRQDMETMPAEDRGRDQSLLSIIDNVASKSTVKSHIRRVVPNGADQATLAFDSVPFDNLVAYLVKLQSQFGVVVTRINVDKLAEQGLVRANLTLQR